MKPERWKHLKALFETVVEKDAAAQAAYLDDACGADADLRRELEALLARHSQDSFLEKPVRELLPEFPADAPETMAGKRLGPYEIIRRIGRGGMGIVYLGRDTRLDRQVAIKMVAPAHLNDPGHMERLRIEARAAARLAHPGIATVFSLEESGDGWFMVTEYVQGHTLREALKSGRSPFARVLDIAVQIAGALAAAHEQGVIHRDLKPDNIMLTQSGAIKILDFGLAKIDSRSLSVMETRLTRSGMFLGTPAYASPEQLLGNPVDHTTDIFSFGILLYEMTLGRHPFGTTDSMATIARILEGDMAEPSHASAAIPRDFGRLVRRCLAKQPQDRYRSTRDLLLDLQRLTDAPPDRPAAALWWWQFHQACAAFGYYGMLYPLWRVREWLGGVDGSLLFFPALVAVGVSANLRLHLWFMSRFYAAALADQRCRAGRWIRWADWLFVLMLALTAVYIHNSHARIATLLLSVSVGSLVAFLIIEPATAKVALDRS